MDLAGSGRSWGIKVEENGEGIEMRMSDCRDVRRGMASRGFTLTDRKEIIKDCLKKPFKLVFTPLGDYDSLEDTFKTEKEAKEELAKIIRDKADEIKSAGGFHAEILKRIIIESKEVGEDDH